MDRKAAGAFRRHTGIRDQKGQFSTMQQMNVDANLTRRAVDAKSPGPLLFTREMNVTTDSRIRIPEEKKNQNQKGRGGDGYKSLTSQKGETHTKRREGEKCKKCAFSLMVYRRQRITSECVMA